MLLYYSMFSAPFLPHFQVVIPSNALLPPPRSLLYSDSYYCIYGMFGLCMHYLI